MTTPLPPNYTYYNGSSNSAVFMKVNTPVGLSPLVIESADKEQSITLTAGPTGPVGMTLRNNEVGATGVALMQLSAGGSAQIQTQSGVTQLLDPLVIVGNTPLNAAIKLQGPTGTTASFIKQEGERMIFDNVSTEEPSGGIQFIASTNSVQFLLKPRDKDANIQIKNLTAFPSVNRSVELGLSEAGVGYIRNNGGSEFVLQEDNILLGSGIGVPVISASGLAGTGQVYDTRFNPVIEEQGTVYQAPYSISSQKTQLIGELTPGKYMMQARCKTFNAGTDTVVYGDALNIFVQNAGMGGNYLENSEIVITSTMIGVQPSLGSSNEPTFTSGFFTVKPEDAAVQWSYFVEPEGTNKWWSFGNAGSSGGINNSGVFIETHKIG